MEDMETNVKICKTSFNDFGSHMLNFVVMKIMVVAGKFYYRQSGH